MRVAVNGLHFECRVDGPGVVPREAPWVVLSNSLMTNMSAWDAQVAALESGCRILRYDQRGHGASDVPTSPCTFEELSGDLIALMDHFEIRRAVVAGASMGGATALLVASHHPARCDGVLAADAQWMTPPANVRAWDERIAVARDGTMAALVEPTVRRWCTALSLSRNPPALERVREMIRATPFDGFVACVRALQQFDIRDAVRAIRVPARFVVGEEDPLAPVMQEMQHAVAGSRLVTIAGAGHLPHVEQPAAFTEALADFLRQIRAGP